LGWGRGVRKEVGWASEVLQGVRLADGVSCFFAFYPEQIRLVPWGAIAVGPLGPNIAMLMCGWMREAGASVSAESR
jgi:hypothetical protein